MAYVEEYEGEVDARRRRKNSRRTAVPAAPAAVVRPSSPVFDEWRSSHEPSKFPSPYRSSKPDIQSAESRNSSKEWSRTDSSLRAPTSTMPSSLHTSRSPHRGAHGTVRYRRGKEGHPVQHGRYDGQGNHEEEDDYDGIVELQRSSPSRRSGSRIEPSSRPSSTRRSRSAQIENLHQSYAHSRARSSRRSISESEDSDNSEDDNDDDRYDDETEESSSSLDEEEMLAHETMPTIPEHDTRARQKTADRLRSRSSPRHQPPADDEGYRGEDIVVVEEAHAPPRTISPVIPNETPGLETEVPPTHVGHAQHLDHLDYAQQPHHPHPVREGLEDASPHDDYHGKPRRRSRKSKSKYPEEERGGDGMYRRPHRKSHHADAPDSEEELSRYQRPHHTLDEEEDLRDPRLRDRHHSHLRHGAKTRPVSPPAPPAYSPERSRLGSSHRPHHRRRSSMDDAKPVFSKGRRYRSEDQIYATPPRKAHTSGPHIGSSHGASTSKRTSFLGNMLGFSRPTTTHEKPSKQVQCIACLDNFPSSQLPKLKCGHRMCPSCLERAFRLSLSDPQHMPPKCCSQDQIPLAYVNQLFDDKFKKKWNRKLIEHTMKNPTYCPSKNCNTLLMPSDIIRRKGYRCKMGICPKCDFEVCTTCKGRWHKSKECPHDPEASKLLDKAKQEGWQMQKCHRCNRLVELKEGCNHMTCRCGAQFCMLCGQKWKKCDCPWFNYDDVDEDGALDYLNIDPPAARNDNPFAPVRPHAARPLGGYLAGRHPVAPIGNNPQQLRPHRAAPPLDFESELPQRRRRRDGVDGARRAHHTDAYDDEYEFVDNTMLDIVRVGNQDDHFMNDDYRIAPISMNPPALLRAATTGTAMLPERLRQKVGFRTGSQERRLADRFTNSRPSPTRRSGPLSAPLASMSHIGPSVAHMGSASALEPSGPPPPAPLAPIGRLPRRRAIEGDIYNETPTRRSRTRATPERIIHGYIEEPGDDEPRRPSLAPKSSVMAGLTGEGRGLNRVWEWRTHVFPGSPDGDSAVAAA